MKLKFLSGLFSRQWFGRHRWIFRGLSGIGAGIILLAVRLADPEPYFQLDAYTDVTEGTRDASQASAARRINPVLTLKAGFARLPFLFPFREGAAGVSVPIPVFPADSPLAGYGDRKGHPATGIRDDIFLSVIALEQNGEIRLFLGMDSLIVPRRVSDGIIAMCLEDFSIPAGHVFMTATHTHSGIGGWARGPVGEIFAGEFNPEIISRWVELTRQTIAISINDMIEVDGLKHVEFSADRYIRNRLDGRNGRVYGRFKAVEINRAAGPDILVGVFSAHPILFPASNLEFSADYPGYWRRTVEANGDVLGVFAGGAMGSHSPRVPEVSDATDRPLSSAEVLGTALGVLTINALGEAASDTDLKVDSIRIDVSLPPLQLRLSDHLTLAPWLARRLLDSQGGSFFTGLRLGQSVFLGAPGDYSGELALELEAAIAVESGRGPAGVSQLRPVCTSFNGDYLGYLVPGRYYYYNSYESRVMSFYGHGWNDLCQFALEKVHRSLAGF
jgi:hypothetical protein